MSTKEIKFPKGTVITCPSCKKEIGVSNRDIYRGELINSCAWDGEAIFPAARLLCPDDGESYFKDGKLHTSKGWM